jgi:hypothetical protein
LLYDWMKFWRILQTIYKVLFLVCNFFWQKNLKVDI